MAEVMRLDVHVTISGSGGTRLGINESVDAVEMDFAQLSRLLEAFHIIAESVQHGRNVNINGRELRYFGA